MSGINGFPGFISDFVRGSTKKFVIEITQNGSPIDITGSKFLIIFKKKYDPNEAIFLQIIIDPPTDPQNGKTEGVITDTDSLSFDPGEYFYTVKFIMNGENYPIDMGKVSVSQCLDETIN